MAVDFLNKALLESVAVAFIMPITALKYSLQTQINKNAKLLYNEILPDNSFELPDKTEYSCKAVFQIWTLNESKINLREQKPLTKHNDFVLYRHNATQTSKKYLDFDWDFCVYAQGYKNYSKIFTIKDKEFLKERINNSNDQFYFIKANNEIVLKRLKSINYNDLAHTNHITPGFCKNDIIKKYKELYESC